MKVFDRCEEKGEETDEQLVTWMVQGDFLAYGRLIRRHQLLVNRLAYALTQDREKAGELAIATLITLWVEREKAQHVLPLPHYLMRLMIRLRKSGHSYLSDN